VRGLEGQCVLIGRVKRMLQTAILSANANLVVYATRIESNALGCLGVSKVISPERLNSGVSRS
jgi:hypothetical protein